MSWLALVRVTLEFLGPLVAKLVEELLARARDDLEAAGPPGSAAAAIRAVFGRARDETWPWQVGRRRLLAACERVALARAAELHAATQGCSVPRLTRAEEAAIAEAV